MGKVKEMVQSAEDQEQRVIDFKKRMETEMEFCEELFKDATVRLMACKYAYYIKNNNFIDDYAYDLEEKGWFAMGVALGHLKETETSPCIDFDEKHPLAQAGIELANKLMRK
jgi:hypothetical protein